MKVLFLTHGGSGIGFGHIRRCLAIANYIRRKKLGRVSFSVSGDATAFEYIKRSGFSKRFIKPHVTVIDTKLDVRPEIEKLKKLGSKIVLIDNTTKARFLSNTVIYPVAHFRDNLDWKGFTGKIYTGSEYFPLGPLFKRPRKKSKKETLHCLITMGGGDPKNITSKIIKALKGVKIPFRATIALGPSFTGKLPRRSRRFQVVRNCDIAALKSVGLAFSTFGITPYELAYMGIPTVIICNFSSDRRDAKKFASFGSAISLGSHSQTSQSKIRRTFIRLARDRRLRAQMARKGQGIVDGKGASRICSIIRRLSR